MSSATVAPDGPPAPSYRRRRRLPVLVLVLVLAVAGGLVWTRVLNSGASETTGVKGCPAPAPPAADAEPPPPLGSAVKPAVFADVAPAAPRDVPVRVLNANGQRGQAALVSAELVTSLGFAAAPDASANDPVYVQQNMGCVGQIRFGPAGLAQARTLHLVVPCAELISDERPDPAVDLALGTEFGDVAPGPDATVVLKTLQQGTPEAPAEIDPALLGAAGDVRC